MVIQKTLCEDGTTIYRDSCGKFHRDDGPAVTYPDGTTVWFQFGKIHRIDGPAITYLDGTQQFWFEDNHIELMDQKIGTEVSDLAHQSWLIWQILNC